MRKIGFVVLLIFVATFAFAQWDENGSNVNNSQLGGIKSFGKGDIWTFDPTDIEEDGQYVEVYFNLDMQATIWRGFIPQDEGLVNVGMMFEFNRNDPSEAYFMFAYESEYDLHLPNYIIVTLMNGDSFMMGGRTSSGDVTVQQKFPNGRYLCGTGMYLTPEWINWFINNDGGYYTFSIREFNYGDDLWFNIPEEFFNIVHQVYETYTSAE